MSQEKTIPDVMSLVGYLNFSQGLPDEKFRKGINELPYSWNTDGLWKQLRTEFPKLIKQAQAENPTILGDCIQAETVWKQVMNVVFPGYLAYQSDLLGHLKESDHAHPFFLCVMIETTIRHLAIVENETQFLDKVLYDLNNYIGYRPVAVLENDRKSEPYAHEYLCPIPLYFTHVGVGHGIYHDLIASTFQLFRETPEEFLIHAHLTLDDMHELCLDPRAFDCLNPAFKRTNYIFGEWDPEVVGLDGRFHRFVIRKHVIDALVDWIKQHQKAMGMEEALFDASAALCGTILMASSVSGAGPGTHDSTASLASIMPSVAGYRDQFYVYLMSSTTGERAERLKKLEEQSRQPFGHVRQALNQTLSQITARQAQYRQLSMIYAHLGYPELSHKEVKKIPAPAFRFESEILVRMKTANISLSHKNVEDAILHVKEVGELLFRGIECGAFVDPWNILGFQGLYPLFQNREDSIQDPRVDILLEIIHHIFLLHNRIVCEAAQSGYTGPEFESFMHRFKALADKWDSYATNVVEGLPHISGQKYYQSAIEIGEILKNWSQEGKPINAIAFWRQQQSLMTSPFSYAAIIDALLKSGDQVVAIGLMMEWLSHAEEWPLDTPLASLNNQLIKWLKLVMTSTSENSPSQNVSERLRKLFDFLEVNAGHLWNAPHINLQKNNTSTAEASPAASQGENPEEEELFEEEQDLFSAAYEEVVFRDTADDGTQGPIADSGKFFELTELERIQMRVEPHLRFLGTLAKLWQFTGHVMNPSRVSGEESSTVLPQETQEIIEVWLVHIRELLAQFKKLLNDLANMSLEESHGVRDENYEFDAQNQARLQLLISLTNTYIQFQLAEWALAANLEADHTNDSHELPVVNFIRNIKKQNLNEIRNDFPKLLSQLKKLQLLYTPYDQGGEVDQVIGAQSRLSFLKLMLSELPRLGLYREAWQLLGTCFMMERRSRPKGPSITEFDRLFRETLETTLRAILKSSQKWKRGKISDVEVIEILDEVLEFYRMLWKEHSATMRLSAAEALSDKFIWKEIESFIADYGADLFHPRQLSLSNLRAILQRGVDNYLEVLEEESEDWDPPRILVDINKKSLDNETALNCLDIIFNIVVDRYERFIEYNSTTTQSDYGEKLTCFLDFMRIEVEYERDDWMLMPVKMLYEILVGENKMEIADSLYEALENQTREKAEWHLKTLNQIQQRYGVKLPSVSDYIHERFVKSLGIKQMLGCVEAASTESKLPGDKQVAIQRLRNLVAQYQKSTQGSIVDLPEWLHELWSEVMRLETKDETLETQEYLHPAEMIHVSLTEFRKQLRKWDDPIDGKKSRKPEDDEK
jgi:hypothetical protein